MLIGSGVGLPVDSAFWVPKVRQLGQKAPLGCFSFTSNIDHGAVKWLQCSQGAYARYALATCSLTTFKPFSLSWERLARSPSLEGPACRSAGSGRSWTSKPTVVVTAGQVGTGFIGIQLAKVLGAGTVVTAATGSGIDFVNGLSANVVVDYHEQNIRYPGQ